LGRELESQGWADPHQLRPAPLINIWIAFPAVAEVSLNSLGLAGTRLILMSVPFPFQNEGGADGLASDRARLNPFFVARPAPDREDFDSLALLRRRVTHGAGGRAVSRRVSLPPVRGGGAVNGWAASGGRASGWAASGLSKPELGE
jgi:hypothetical protein